ncbi:RNA-binding domain-containing protein [Desulfobulbus oligotrophicus]|uniref:Putative DNA binding domain-containing protein n=1 Tax=Desulfobulbus oligotrophicus TaxID=1909699 RepID=A0A7T5VD92_9BACT|nr:RNA-binding domain-containing protein [Desulfobulbus oligotrophicus]QQG65671.1 putative DNA binding domain-containing protein [Desulfobulbus oligotrophicus]
MSNKSAIAQLLEQIALGEYSRQQFKRSINHPDALAAELVAFSNSGGGTLLIGVNDDGSIAGLDTAEVRRTNQMLSNTASQHMRPPISFLTENVLTEQGMVIIVTIPDGVSKPYLDHQGRIWIKQGADKRQLIAREELQRMFQRAGLVYADIVPVADTTSADLDETVFRQYLNQHYGDRNSIINLPLDAILQNLGLGDGRELNLSGLLLFGRNPQRWRPVCSIKAVTFPGTSIADTRYLDSLDIGGTLKHQYTEALAFIKRNLHRVQGEQDFNSPGILEIPEITLQELLVNALVHRDYFTSASIRILIFTDRIEIISPGHLPDSLSLDDIRHGKTNRRNPTLSEHAFRILPYRGVGSGIPRALEEWPQIELKSEVSGNQFTALIRRPAPQWQTSRDLTATTIMSPIEAERLESRLESQLESQLESRLAARLVLLIAQAEAGKQALARQLGHQSVSGELHKQIRRLLDMGLIEMTRPDKPSSRLQQYRLTEAGKQLVQKIREE